MTRWREWTQLVAGVAAVIAAVLLVGLWQPAPLRHPTAGAASPLMAPVFSPTERSIAFLPAVIPDDFEFDTAGFAEFISRDVAHAIANEPGVRIADEAAAEVYRGWQGEPVVAAAALGVRFVFVARLSGGQSDARVDVSVTDARTGAVVFEGPFYVDRENAPSVPEEIAQALVLEVFNQVPGFTPMLTR